MPHSNLALPAPDRGWILCSGSSETARGADLRELAGKRRDLLVGLPATSVSTFLVDLPPVEETLHESMILAQVDKRGLAGRGSALVDYERLAHGERGDTFAVRVAPELPPAWIVPSAAGYTLSATLRVPSLARLSPNETSASIWREHDRLVLGLFVGGAPALVQVLGGKPEPGKALAAEVNLILLGLGGERLFEQAPPTELVLLLDGVDEKELAEFRTHLSLPVRLEAPRPPAKGEARPRLLPADVSRHRRRRRSVARNLALLAGALIVYAVAGAWIWKEAQATKREIASLEYRIAIVQPDAERVQLAEERWRALEPAFDKDLFPVVQLSRITSALPGSGVVVRQYRTTGRQIRLRGQARDVQLANRLLEDLQGMEGFERYEWSMPNPKVERNNTATFEIEGKLKHEG